MAFFCDNFSLFARMPVFWTKFLDPSMGKIFRPNLQQKTIQKGGAPFLEFSGTNPKVRVGYLPWGRGSFQKLFPHCLSIYLLIFIIFFFSTNWEILRKIVIQIFYFFFKGHGQDEISGEFWLNTFLKIYFYNIFLIEHFELKIAFLSLAVQIMVCILKPFSCHVCLKSTRSTKNIFFYFHCNASDSLVFLLKAIFFLLLAYVCIFFHFPVILWQ